METVSQTCVTRIGMCAFASDNAVFYAQSTSTVISGWAFASGCCILLYMQLTWMLKRHVINRMTIHLALCFGVSAGGPGAAGRCGDLCQQEVGCEPDGVQQHCGGAGRRLQLAVLLLLYTLHLSGQFQTVCVEGGLWGELGLNQTEYNSIVVELGGDYNWQHSPSCAHFIFQVSFWLCVCVGGGGGGVEPDRVQQHCGGVGRRLQLAAFTLLHTLHLSGQFLTVGGGGGGGQGCLVGGGGEGVFSGGGGGREELGLNQTEYNSTVVELGGDYNCQYSPFCTHFIFQVSYWLEGLGGGGGAGGHEELGMNQLEHNIIVEFGGDSNSPSCTHPYLSGQSLIGWVGGGWGGMITGSGSDCFPPPPPPFWLHVAVMGDLLHPTPPLPRLHVLYLGQRLAVPVLNARKMGSCLLMGRGFLSSNPPPPPNPLCSRRIS